MPAPLLISNADARRLFLERHALSMAASPDFCADRTLALVKHLGFVQLDSINTVERAHHLILFSRAPGYSRDHLADLHHERRDLFEHWTHDASLIPMEFYPHWRHRFAAAKAKLADNPRWQERIGADGANVIRKVRTRIRRDGPAMARDFEDKGKGSWWGWGPSKTALETLWRTGELAIARREGFEKVYDLAERVIPDDIRRERPSLTASTDFLCREALARLGFATPQEIAAFWRLMPIERVRAWAAQALKRGAVIEVAIEDVEGATRKALALPDIEAHIAEAPEPPATLRFLSPFDPAIRDRARAARLFGFDYRIEVFVPEKKRRYGYYVLPLLEGDRFIGRADVKAHRAEGRLEVKGFWSEPGIKLTKAREAGIRRALTGLARFTGTPEIDADAALRRARAG
ncbi:crosslink repair DNA glycosylase YcaQ family protein [Parvibaculum sp.]|uniref:winged helix-turn-helix domain-containing protein n=1 Tax=Parvibaculum sp. TaxID=2024848 RepID=UPI001DB72FEA|nr:crosslink repair DNA glycosylase YcaQ family protein [Parvibaculum sp.]MBX3489435.1 YcaQ family DNA glycosylase [Parvibaculum sp.]MCW5726609.1 YcaQ family DNA glycosylase [Parvibaculum sp.]